MVPRGGEQDPGLAGRRARGRPQRSALVQLQALHPGPFPGQGHSAHGGRLAEQHRTHQLSPTIIAEYNSFITYHDFIYGLY